MDTLRVVLDTNVLRAGLYSAEGASFVLLRAVEQRRLVPVLSTALLFEYEEILRRDQALLRLSDVDVEVVLDGLCEVGEHHTVHFLWRPALADPSDDCILELAVAAGRVPIVRHNVRDFAAARLFGVRVIRPVQMLRDLG